MKKLITRFAVYFTGLFLLSIAIAFAIKSQSGVSPVSSVPYVFSQITGLSVGTMTFLVYLLYVVLQIIILKKDFPKKYYLQFLFSSVFGAFTDFSLYLIRNLPMPNYFVQLIYLGISIILMAISVFLIITADIVPNAPDGLCVAISRKKNMEFSAVKIRFDITCVIVSGTIALLAFGNLSQLREGTILSAVFVGRTIGIIETRYRDRLKILIGDVNLDEEAV